MRLQTAHDAHPVRMMCVFMLCLIQVEIVNIYQPLTAKPMVYLVNLSEKHFIRKGNKWYV